MADDSSSLREEGIWLLADFADNGVTNGGSLGKLLGSDSSSRKSIDLSCVAALLLSRRVKPTVKGKLSFVRESREERRQLAPFGSLPDRPL